MINIVKILISFALLGGLSACQCNSKQIDTFELSNKTVKGFKIDEDRSSKNLEFFSSAPHPFGSTNQFKIANWLNKKISDQGLVAVEQSFTASVPNPVLVRNPNAPTSLTISKSGKNIIAFSKKSFERNNCLVLLGSHYDTKILSSGLNYHGANDSGSSSILMLELLQTLTSIEEKLECGFGFVWFDGEEPTLDEWNYGLYRHPAKIQDNLYGSRHFVDQLKPCEYKNEKVFCITAKNKKIPVVSLVLMDMVGHKNIKLSYESNSSPKLLKLLEKTVKDLGLTEILSRRPISVLDDHIPFRDKGIAAINLIDFNNLEYWHKPDDTVDKISLESMENIGKISVFLAISIANNPKAFIEIPDR